MLSDILQSFSLFEGSQALHACLVRAVLRERWLWSACGVILKETNRSACTGTGTDFLLHDEKLATNCKSYITCLKTILT
jgi:hypothetical protein